MDEKTLHILEFDKIIEMLCGFASSEAGRSLCAKIRPSSNRKKIREYQKNTTDARKRMELHGSALSFRGVRDLTELLKRLKVEASLSAEELLRVGSLLTAVERARAYDTAEISDSLSEDFSFLEPLSAIAKEIQRCILSEEEIADDASSALFSVRKQIRDTSGKIHEAVQSQLNAYRDYLTDPVITLRDGRYCLPVRAEYKAKVPGLVHDTSSTGMTLFIEPMAAVKLNNDLKELLAREKKEEEAVLLELSLLLAPHTDDLAENIRLLKKLDMIFAKALLSQAMDASEPELSSERYLELRNARHPLIDRKKVVPVTIRLGKEFDMLVITGPNTGGKTVTLKTAGLLTLMAEAGLHIPADEGSTAGIFDEVFADIGDEQSIEQSLSTFSAHMTNIVKILENAGPYSLCLFDELGSGTDPTEGAALAMAVLSDLHRKKIRTIATTHYAEIKVFALRTEGIENACCEFDVASLRPTYRLLIGIPGKSNAFAISRRLGLPEKIIEEAKGFIGSGEESFEDVIQKLNDDRLHAEKERIRAEGFKRESEEMKNRLKKKEERIEEQKEKILLEARAEAQKILREAKDTADETIRNLQKFSEEGDRGRKMEKEREKLREGIRKNSTAETFRQKGPSRPVSPKKLKEGDTVKIMSFGGTEGTVISAPDKDGNVLVRMGFMTSKVSVRDLELSEGGGRKEKTPERSFTGFAPKVMTVSPEINLIGMTTDEAVPVLEKYLDDAALSHLESVRIVHGRGTGALKEAVQKCLRRVKYVKEFRSGVYGEGADGVTVVTFR